MSSFATSWVFHLLVGGAQAAVVGLVAVALVRLAPRSSASWRHALLAIAFVKFAIPPMIPMPFGAFTAMTSAVRPSFGEVESSLRGGDIALALLAIHFAGIVVMTIRWIIASRSWRRWVATSTRDEQLSLMVESIALESGWRGTIPEARIVDSLPVPMAGGILRPLILLPSEVFAREGRARVELVLRHELEHLARRDPWWNFAGSILRVFWWWHPVLAILLRDARRIREERCDDAVVSRFPESAREYAHTLIDLAPRNHAATIPLLACAATGSLFEQRLRRLLDDGVRREAAVGRPLRTALLVFALVTLPGFGLARFDFIRLAHGSAGPTGNHAKVHGHVHLHAPPSSAPPEDSPHH